MAAAITTVDILQGMIRSGQQLGITVYPDPISIIGILVTPIILYGNTASSKLVNMIDQTFYEPKGLLAWGDSEPHKYSINCNLTSSIRWHRDSHWHPGHAKNPLWKYCLQWAGDQFQIEELEDATAIMERSPLNQCSYGSPSSTISGRLVRQLQGLGHSDHQMQFI
ncbi:hypothetical protein EDB19DRAFT_1836918 [Suillus lakei]|nr:hypothetical protein EDB19DRAFT_1836918 [Suillus lakei]